jgi:excisionase family DNA binding protein
MPVLDTVGLAKELGVSPKTISRYTTAGRIPVIRIGSRRRYDLEAVKAALTSQQRTRVSAARPAPVTASATAPEPPVPKLATSLEPGQTYCCGHCGTKSDNKTSRTLPISTECPECGKADRWF